MDLSQGYGYKPYFAEGDSPEIIHQLMAGTLDTVVAEIHAIQRDDRTNGLARKCCLRCAPAPHNRDQDPARSRRFSGHRLNPSGVWKSH